MSKLIDFLVRIAGSAELCRPTRAELYAALARSDLDLSSRWALLAASGERRVPLGGGEPVFRCSLCLPFPEPLVAGVLANELDFRTGGSR